MSEEGKRMTTYITDEKFQTALISGTHCLSENFGVRKFLALLFKT